MHKPGDAFGFFPRNNLSSSDTPTYSDDPFAGPDKTLRHSIRELLDSAKQRTNRIDLSLADPETRVAVTMVHEAAPPKAPLRPWGNNDANGNTSSQAGPRNDKAQDNKGANTPGFTNANPLAGSTNDIDRPAIRFVNKPKTQPSSYIDDKYAHLFIQPKNRPEHHRPQRITGPLGPAYKDKKPPPAPMFNTINGPMGSASNPISIMDGPPTSRYSQPGMFSEYVDPKKAQADIKALLEGAMDEEEEVKDEKVEADKSQVEGLKVRLLPHQVEGVEWMKSRELGPVKKGKVPKGGLLADDMGLGKTLQSIALILSNTKPADKHAGVEKTTLVVAPLALIRQWEAELKEKVTDTHKLKVLVHHGPQRTKKFEDLRRYDVVITTYQILVSEHGNCSGKLMAGCFGLHWYRVILDEAHTIKNRNAKATKACCELRSIYRWCLSGTPMQNNLDELQSLVKFLRITPYDDLKEWREHFDLPMKNGKGEVAFKRLHGILRCFMKRRTKDILKNEGALSTGAESKDGEKSATSSFKVTERKVVAISAKFSPAEQRFYERLEQRTDKSLENMMRGKVNYASALVLLLRLRQTCNHPKLVEGKLEKDRDALMEEAKPKKSVTDVDDLADLLGGLGVETKHCEICGWELDRDNRQAGSEKCKACFADLEYFKHHEEGGDLEAPKARTRRKRKVKTKKVKEVKAAKQAVPKEAQTAFTGRKQRNRRAIIDSDEEEEEGEWIGSGDEQGPLRLGKAGGTDDENADGDGDTIHTEDSEDEETQDGSQLDSFVVDDGNDTKPAELKRAIEESDSDDDDLESLSELQNQLSQRHSLPADPADSEDEDADADSESEDDSEDDDAGISESELDDSERDENAFTYDSRKPREKTPHVLASAKIRQLISILHKEVHEHKFIVFSQFTSMLDLVEPFFRKEGIKYTRYDGGMRNDAREASLDSLRNDKNCRVLLCSLRCGALGLNLTAASRVVILEPFWNPFVEEQAIDRVHRLTQTVDVVVYKLTIENSVEERILQLQEKKRLLAANAIESGAKKESLKLGLKEMLDLFRHVGRDEEEAGRFLDSRTAGDDVADSMGRLNIRTGEKKKSGGSQENSIYGRRW